MMLNSFPDYFFILQFMSIEKKMFFWSHTRFPETRPCSFFQYNNLARKIILLESLAHWEYRKNVIIQSNYQLDEFNTASRTRKFIVYSYRFKFSWLSKFYFNVSIYVQNIYTVMLGSFLLRI